MTTRSAPVTGERRQLINVAYRMLGSLADAEDAVQEAYARWYAMPADRREAVVSPGAWLTTVVSRVCLNHLRSARARREHYVGARAGPAQRAPPRRGAPRPPPPRGGPPPRAR
ncbi:sigma factor, partial [Streptomyces tendae]|uniref:sigma factor n=1 Tax=Streptomyces tendae TaxID=1932 RepID=UPI00365E8CA3